MLVLFLGDLFEGFLLGMDLGDFVWGFVDAHNWVEVGACVLVY